MPDTKTIVKLARSMGFDPSRWDCEQIAKLYGWLPTHGTIDRAQLRAAIEAHMDWRRLDPFRPTVEVEQ
jgi:hypothetical protein